MMDGPGRDVPDPTEGIPNVNGLPAPQLVAYHRDPKPTPCPRCSQRASRHQSGQRTLHDLGDVGTGHPVDLLVASSSHSCHRGNKHCNSALTEVAPPGAHYTHRVIEVAVRGVSEDGLPS